MSTDEDDELARLRRRAYSPTADIASDPPALARLEELERRAAATRSSRNERGPDPRTADTSGAAPSHDQTAPTAVPASASDVSPHVRPEVGSTGTVAEAPRRRRMSLSTRLMIFVGAVVVVVAVVAMTLVQRVHTHPLQAGAEQIARLAPDPSFAAPDFFTQGPAGSGVAYAEFQGFRVVVTPPREGVGSGEPCMAVYQPVLLVEDPQNGTVGYNGQYVPVACAAGLFPAASTIRLFDQAPERAQTDLPAGTALQFVYDEDDDEVVVFRG